MVIDGIPVTFDLERALDNIQIASHLLILEGQRTSSFTLKTKSLQTKKYQHKI
jgi:hypothetical protein